MLLDYLPARLGRARIYTPVDAEKKQSNGESRLRKAPKEKNISIVVPLSLFGLIRSEITVVQVEVVGLLDGFASAGIGSALFMKLDAYFVFTR